MAEKTSAPAIRFGVFTDAWEQRKLGEIANITSGCMGDSLLSDGDFRLTRIESISDGLVNENRVGFTNNRPDDCYLLEAGNILYSNINSISHMGKVAIYKGTSALYHGINLLRLTINTFTYPDFIFYQLNTESRRNWAKTHANKAVSQASINQTLLSQQAIMTCSFDEQMRIGRFLICLDRFIALHQREYDKTVNIKKALLEKMFPKAGEDKPEIRFSGFTGAWERRKLKELVTSVVREVPKPTEPYDKISVRSHAKGTFHQRIENPDAVTMDKLYIVRENDLIVNITFAWEHAIAVATKKDDGLLVSHRFPTYVMNNSDVSFMKYIVSRESFRREMALISPGGAGRNRVLDKNDFLGINILAPSTIEEQYKIGKAFLDLDHLIVTHHRELVKLQNMKKSLLEKMFV